MQHLRGRNLSHIGCTLGLTLGLLLGLILGMLALRIAPSINLAAGVFFGVTVVLGIVGYALGGVATRRLWGSDRSPH